MLDKRLAREAWTVKGYLGSTLILGGLVAVLSVLQARYLAVAVSRVSLRGLLVPVLAVVVLKAAAQGAGIVLAHEGAAAIKERLRKRLAAHLFELGPVFVQGERSGEILNTWVDGVEALEEYFARYLPQLVLAVLIPAIILFFVFPADWTSALILLITAPLIPLFMVLIGKLAEKKALVHWREMSRMSAHFLDILQGLSTLKMFGRSESQSRVIGRVSDNFRRTTLEVLRVAFLSALVLELLATLSTALVAVALGLRLLAGGISFTTALFLLLLAPELYQPLRALGTQFHASLSGVSAANRVFALLAVQVPEPGGFSAASAETRNTGDLSPFASSGARETGGSLSFEKVSYTYPGRSKPCLQGVSFSLERGERVALTGQSGVGKSTVLRLLMGFTEPDRGVITAGGLPLPAWSKEEWRRQVAYVPQHPHLFAASIYENIRLGRRDASRAELLEAAKKAGVEEFVSLLPDGYETQIGEKGTRLSGGQAQRLAIARAFLKDAPLLLLDEPFTGLDAANEERLYRSLESLSRGRTVLVVTHGENALAWVDRVLVLEEGLMRESAEKRVTERAEREAERESEEGERRTEEEEKRPERVATRAVEAGRERENDTEAANGHREGNGSGNGQRNGNRKRHRTGGSGGETEMGHILWLFRQLAPYKGRVFLALLLGTLTIASHIGLMTTSAYLISRAAEHPPILDLMVAIVGVRFFGLLRAVSRYFERYVSHDVTFRILSNIRVAFYRALEPLAPAGVSSFASGDLFGRIGADIEALQYFFLRVFSPPVVAFIILIGSSLFLVRFNPLYGLVFALFYLAGGIGIPWLIKTVGRRTQREMPKARAGLYLGLLDSVQGMADILAFGLIAERLRDLADRSRKLGRLQRREALLEGLAAALTGLTMNLGMWLVLILAVRDVIDGRLAGVFLAAMPLAVSSSFEALLPMPLVFPNLEQSLGATQRLRELIEPRFGVCVTPVPAAKGESGHRTHPRESGQAPAALLSIRNLSFRYSPGGPWVLRGLDLDLERGERVALTGASGAGKSTLVNILLRFRDYETGSVRLQGEEIGRVVPDEVRRRFSVVAQNAYLFNATLRENLLLAKVEATEDELIGAARSAKLHEFIMSLPDGYDTLVGEGGFRLSGGQRQRLALARALLKDAPILILDEATAGLDPETEDDVISDLLALCRDRTVLFVTHHRSVLSHMDRILTLRGGRLSEAPGLLPAATGVL
ncbi:ATP-binding/permease protein CydD [Peptococcaceae bacterium CEB3]|nr:ATP-binding/permease protein CydD [Peptococcaceae bacterium CEB3]